MAIPDTDAGPDSYRDPWKPDVALGLFSDSIEVELSNDNQVMRSRLDKDGNFSFEQIPPGEYTVRINARLFKPFDAQVSIEQGENFLFLEVEREVRERVPFSSVKMDHVYSKGDTLVYQALAFARQSDVPSLTRMKELPGVNYVDDGTDSRLEISGDLVSRSYGNGVFHVSYDPSVRQDSSVPLLAESRSSLTGKVSYMFRTKSVTEEFEDAAEIFGDLPDLSMELPVQGAGVTLYSGSDSLSTSTDMTGNFKFEDVASGSVYMSIEHSRYVPFSESFELLPGHNVVLVELKEEAEELEAAVATAEVPLMSFHGDTLVYNAAAVSLREGDYALDMLRQLPGIQINGRQIIASGKAISRSYVNGALIFGTDPMAAMENLQADQIVSMNVYDESNPQDRLDGRVRERQRVIDIITKNPIFSVTDIQLRAAAGADGAKDDTGAHQNRYVAGANAKFFSEMKQLSADVVTNNMGMESSLLSVTPKVLTGYRENTSVGLKYEKYFKDRLYGDGLQASYSYGHSWSKSRSRVLSEYFETSGIPGRTVDDERSSTLRQDTHGISTAVAYRTNPHFSLTWHNDLSLSENAQSGLSAGSTVISGHGALLGRHEETGEETGSWSVSERLSLTPKKPGVRLPVFTASLKLGRGDVNSFSLDTLSSSYARRYLTKDGGEISRSYGAGLSQVLLSRIAESLCTTVSAQYNISYDRQKLTREAWDLYGAGSPSLNMSNTYDYTYSDLHNELYFRTILSRMQARALQSVWLDLRLVSDRILDDEYLPATVSVDKTYYGLLPGISLFFKRVHVEYKVSSRLPSVQQLRDRIDDSNPLMLTAGNPDLYKAVIHSLTVNSQQGSASDRKAWQKSVYDNFSWRLSLTCTDRPIVSTTTFFPESSVLPEYGSYVIPAGASLNRAQNADYSFNASGSMTYSRRLSLFGGKLKPTLTAVPGFSYTDIPQYFGAVQDHTREISPTMRLSAFASLGSGARFDLNAYGIYSHSRNGGGSMDMETLRGTVSGKIELPFLKKCFLSTDYEWSPYRYLTEGYGRDVDIHRLNGEVGVKLFGDSLRISLLGLDLLNGGSVYTTSLGASSYIQTWAPSYGRCLLLNLSWRFNSSGGRTFPIISF